MTTKILTGTYSSGYTLSGAYSGVWVKPTGKVIGAAGTYRVLDGTMGGVGLDLPDAGTAHNEGAIVGGAGGNGVFSNSTGGAGGGGGVAVVLESGGRLVNTNAIYGGPGGYAHYGGQRGGEGGFGGDGADLDAKGTVINSGVIQGGVGQLGASGGSYSGSDGQGGVGVYLRAGGAITNLGRISAGGEGHAATLYPSGVMINGGGVITNGSATDAFADIDGGNSGNGIQAFNGPLTVKNFGDIIGEHFSVLMMSGGGRIIAEQGSSFSGEAYGDGGALELVGGGTTISNLGSTATVSGSISGQFVDFTIYQFDAGGSWTLAGSDNVLGYGDSLTDQGTFDIASTSVLEVHDGAVVADDSLLSNDGIIALESTTSFTDVRIGAGATLDNSGTITLFAPKSRIVGLSATAELDNYHLINGRGSVGGNGLVLVNHIGGTIEAIGGSLSIQTGAGFLVNGGVLAAASGATLMLEKGLIQQLPNSGTIAALSGGVVDLADVVVEGGTLSQSGTGVLRANVSGGVLDGATGGAGAVYVSGVLEVLNGIALTLEGTIHNAGALDTKGSTAVSKFIVASDGASLTGGGQVKLAAHADNALLGSTASALLTNVDNRIAGAGRIGGGSMALVNEAAGVIAGTSSVTLTIDTGANSIVNAGAIESLGSGRVIVKSAVNNTGKFLASTGTLVLDGAVSGAGVADIRAGVLDVAGKFAETVTFQTGSTGVLQLADWAAFTGKVRGLSTTGANSLDLLGFTLSGAKATYSGTTTSGVLRVSNGTQTAKITLLGNYLASTFTVASDGHGGVTVKDPPLQPLLSAAPH
ncbi:MAG TPA: hypothetical protein VG166_12280 [Caulobacteraceae bacterium]|nr:hypothetical protein [Caulobacteraceae bacterium]